MGLPQQEERKAMDWLTRFSEEEREEKEKVYRVSNAANYS